MRTKLLSVEEAQDFLGSQLLHSSSNSRDLQAVRAVMRVAMEEDLTPRQRDCVWLYFFEGMTMERVGQELGIGKSTVYRHLQKALGRMRRAIRYAQALRAAQEDG